MRAPRHLFIVTLVVQSILSSSGVAAAQLSDQAAAERVLGPQWKRLSRRAGMILAGTVLATPPAGTSPASGMGRPASGAIPEVQYSFRVDEAIAGVERGQVLTIHEWAGASSMHGPMIKGQRFLIFFYPPSRLGLTSPVGGSLGQVALDRSISVVQLARAIRGAREE